METCLLHLPFTLRRSRRCSANRCVRPSPRSTGGKGGWCTPSGPHVRFPSGGQRRTSCRSRFLLPHLLREHTSDQRDRAALRLRTHSHGLGPLLRELEFLPGPGLQRTDLLLSQLGFAHPPRCLLVFPPRVVFVTGRGFLSPTGLLRRAAGSSFLPLDFLLPSLHSHPVVLNVPIHLG